MNADADQGVALKSGAIRALLIITFLYPVVLCAIFFPTPSPDLREHINLGLTFPLTTPKSPPLQSWIAGVIALSGARDGWLYVLVAQILNFIAIFYLALTARKFIGPQTLVPLLIMATGGLFYSAATPSMALNSDQIQAAIWAGFFFHALSAWRDDRWRDWLAAGALVGVAFLAKYSSVIFLAVFLAAALTQPATRRIFSNPRFYAAAVFANAITSIAVVPAWLHSHAFEYGVSRFMTDLPLLQRAFHSWEIVRSLVFYGAPALIGLGILAWRGNVSRPRLPAEPAQRLIVMTTLGILALLFAMTLLGGLIYSARYSYPLFGLALLALLCTIDISPRAVPEYARISLIVWGAIVAGTLVYTQLAIHRVFREPAPAGAALLREAWDRQYRCGPGIVLGDNWTARAIAINFGRPVFGLAFEDARHGAIDRSRGVIIVVTPDRVWPPDAEQFLKDRPLATVEVPYRRTWRSEKHTYRYYFIAPERC